MNACELPAKVMKASTTPVIVMLATMMERRPMRSERCPATGDAAKPAACSANMAAPTHMGEKCISYAR